MSDLEEITVERGERSGALMTVAVHSTVLGPALGGGRLWRYDRPEAAIEDARRLAEAMTYKASAAGLDLGGGKGVIAAPGEMRPEGDLRRAILLDFGDLVESLEGRYVTAEDVGTGAADMAVIQAATSAPNSPDSRIGAGVRKPQPGDRGEALPRRWGVVARSCSHVGVAAWDGASPRRRGRDPHVYRVRLTRVMRARQALPVGPDEVYLEVAGRHQRA